MAAQLTQNICQSCHGCTAASCDSDSNSLNDVVHDLGDPLRIGGPTSQLPRVETDTDGPLLIIRINPLRSFIPLLGLYSLSPAAQ